MNQIGGTKDPEAEPVAQSLPQPQDTPKPPDKTDSATVVAATSTEEQEVGPEEKPVPMEEDLVNPATVFSIRLKQSRSNLLHKMSVPELCRNFSAVSWCGKLNAIACAAETCARIPSSTANPPFWIPIHIVIPERPTECAVFNVIADSPRDSVQFIEWSPTSCPRALLIANFHGRVTIWTQSSQGPANLVHDTSCWQREHEWRQDIAVVTKWLSGVSPYRWLSSKSSAPANSKSTFEEKFLSQQSQTSARWPNFLCVCSVFSSGSVQLHWSQWPPSKNGMIPKWFCTSKGLLGCGPSGIMAGDAIITDSGAMHVAGVPIVNPSTIVVWEVTPGPGNGFQIAPKTSTTCAVPPLSPSNWAGFAPLAAYLFSWQDYLLSEAKQGKKQTDQNLLDAVPLYCSPVSNFSAYVSPEAAAQSAATTTWGSGVTAVAFDPTRAGSVIAVVIVEGQYMSPYDPDEGPSITGWRVQRWESSLQHVVLHPIFGNPTSSLGGQSPMQTVWQSKVDLSITPTNDFKNHQSPAIGMTSDVQKVSESVSDKSKRVNFDPFDLPSDVRTLARVVYSAHGGEIAIAFLRGGVHVFSGPSFTPVDNYQINVGSAIAAPAFSSTSCCSASVWHDSSKNCTILRIIRVLPPSIPISQVKANSSTWERAIAERFWWSLLVGVDWWDAVGCTQSAAEDGIVSLNSVIAVLDADFHSLPSIQHRQQYGPSLDRIKCRLLEGSNAQEVRAMVLDMQARLLLDMLGKGIESALINSSALVPEPWQASGETLSSIDPETMAVEPALIPSIQAYVDSVLDLASHFITRLRRYASFCRTLASHAVTAGTGSNRNMVASPTQSSATPATSQGGQNGTSSSMGSAQLQTWVQGAIAKISNTTDGGSNPTPNPISGPSTFMPISINTGTFPGTPAVRLIGDCHFLHRLCQLLLFCFFFRRTQLPRYMGLANRTSDANTQKPQSNTPAPGKVEEIAKPVSAVVKSDDGQTGRAGAKGAEEVPSGRSRLGSGNAGQGYTFEEVKVLFMMLMDLCRRTAGLQHPLPVSQVGSNNIQVRLHYIDGNYTVLPEVVEASLGPHMQNMPRPRGADAAGLLLRELELHPPAEEWHRRNMFGGPWSDQEDVDCANDAPKLVNSDPLDFSSLEHCVHLCTLTHQKAPHLPYPAHTATATVTTMAEEPETNPPPPDPPILSAPEAVAETAPPDAATASQPSIEIAAPPALAPKRQRRPSVRLGEIGDQRAALHGHDSHTRRPSMPPWSWRTPKESSRTSKARSVTNLANGGEEFGNTNNKRGKAKRGGPAAKRLRSNWTLRATTDENGDEEGFRDFENELDQDQSPVHSVEDNGVDYWHVDRSEDPRVRVSENDAVESESRERRKSDGVRSWLFELGLGRYAPMFEIHEVDDELLPMLTLEDLKDMGINAVGSRRKMYNAIQKLRKCFP